MGLNERVITHELGHTIGFRHMDYHDRTISCGNVGAGTKGAILITGAPSTARVGGSVMDSCLSSTETGEWTRSDRTALDFLYSQCVDELPGLQVDAAPQRQLRGAVFIR